ncbi:MAG: radical SAM protein [Pseudomonadota bacterium]
MLRKILQTGKKILVSSKSVETFLNENKSVKFVAERVVNMREDYPFEYVLEITTRCNHYCKMCTFKHKEKTNRGDMSFDHYKKIIDELPVDRELVVEFAGGGEPLLHKQFLKFLEYGKKKLPKSRFFLSTNGSLLNEKMAKSLIDLELDLLNIGLNSATREGHEYMTNAKNFDVIVENSINFFKIKNKNGFRKPYAFVQIIECEELKHEIEPFKEFWEPIADKLHIRHVIAGMDSSVLDSESLTQIYPNAPVRYPCALPFRCMAIGANGDLFPCNIFSHEGDPWANIENNTITEMWGMEKMKRLRQIHLEGAYYKEKYCKECDMWNYSGNFFIKNHFKIGNRMWW